METMRTIKALFARLAGAPLAPPRDPTARRRSLGHGSGLYAPDPDPDPDPAWLSSVRTTKQRDGDEGEAFARRYLERAGLLFIAAKVRFRDGELDLVMRDPRMGRVGAGTLVFVEVRRRARDSHGGAAGSITREKRRRIVAAASHYLVGLGLRALPPCRFDVVTIEGDARQGFRVDWIRDAFREDG
jgi:putative endonuclease